MPTKAILHHGRLVLESLHNAKEAARVHAARIDLQAAMLEAENRETSRHWKHAN